MDFVNGWLCVEIGNRLSVMAVFLVRQFFPILSNKKIDILGFFPVKQTFWTKKSAILVLFQYKFDHIKQLTIFFFFPTREKMRFQ